MEAKLAAWCLLTLLLGNFSEGISKSWNINKSSQISTIRPFSVTWGTLNIRLESRKLNISHECGKELPKNLGILENIKKKDKFKSKLSLIGDHVFGTLLLVSCILALLGNGCALIIFRFRQQTFIPMEVFFTNLAVLDILLSVASYPMSIIASFNHAWNFGDFGCTVYAFCCYFFSLSSIYTITAMALTRYLITCKPVQGNQITCWTCCKMITVGYVLAFVFAAMPLLGFGSYGMEPFGLSCTLDWIAEDQASRVYMIVVTIFWVIFPLIILVYCYTQIVMLVKQSNELLKNTGVNKRNTDKSNVQLTWISGLISTGFIVAWFPYTIACLWSSFQGKMILPIWLTPVPALFAKTSIVYNPLIYVFLIARYRRDFYKVTEYISCKLFSVRRRETNGNTKNETRTANAKDGNRSTNCQSQISNNTYRIDGDMCGTSKNNFPVQMKQSCV